MAVAKEFCIVGMGSRRYAVEREWGRLPRDLAFSFMSWVAVDSRGFLHVLQRGEPPVIVLDPDGDCAGHYAEGRIADGHGLTCDAGDRMFIVDRDAHQVIATTREGEELMRLGERHQPHWNVPFNHPTHVAVAPDGEIYVGDGYGNARVHRFDSAGRHVQSWGEIGSLPGQFRTPHSLCIDRDDRVLVADRENDRVQIFSRDGAVLGEWTGLYHPMCVFADRDGLIWVTDQIPSLTAFAADGSRIGRCRPALNGAHSMTADAAGNLYLSEIQPNRITRLRRLD